MSYLDDEISVSGSAPVELYKFVGTYSSYYYTSGPQPVDYNDGLGLVTYLPIDIERNEVKVGTQEDDNLDCVIKMAVYQQVVVDYGFTTSPPKLTLTIYRVQPTGVGIYWVGPVNNISVDDQARASLRCPSALGNALVGNVPNVYYQKPCNNVLYDARCQVPYAANSNVTTVSAVDPTDAKNVTVASIGALDGKLIGGELALGSGEVRMIVAQTGDVLRVNFPFNTITVGGACTIAAGCDHLYQGDCKNKFANQVHFNGFMFIPPDNPFTTGIEPGAEGVADTACVFVHTPPVAYWATVTLDFTHGPALPHLTPGWGYTFSLAGTQVVPSSGSISTLYYGPENYEFTYDGLGRVLSLVFTFWKTGQGPVGAATWATDPFAGGVDAAHINLQWTYGEFSFPEGHGGMEFILDRVSSSELCVLQPPLSGTLLEVYGLFPIGADYAV